MKLSRSGLLIAVSFVAALSSRGAVEDAASWPLFRGPGAGAVGSNAQLPEQWSASKNVAWKRDIPGRSWSSPIVWADTVFVVTAISPGESEPAKKGLYLGGERPNAPRPEHQWKMLCLDLNTGAIRWERLLHQGPPPEPVHLKNSYASQTPVTDGKRVYAFIGNVGVFALDFEGHPAWSRPVHPRKVRYGWGPAASPVLYGDRLYLVNDNDEQSYLLAMDKTTGKEVWRTERDEKSNWSTPFIWVNDQRTEIVTAGTGAVRSYDLEGKLLWRLEGMSSITVATPYADAGLLYVSSGFIADKTRPIYAIRPGDNGDISLQPGQTNNTGIAWSQPLAAPYIPSTLVYDGRLYVLYDRGELSAFNARTGAPLYTREKLPEGLHFTASPWAGNGHIFCLNEDGITFVLRAGDRFELLHTNKLAEDDMCMATPAAVGDRLLIRSAVRLYCIKAKP
ncbi:MAG: PQQ-binding-like beta-propeller repeat protein [Candidatus Omnitrophica bacterium]|nr:PQQ-binding-like beta-propeller repeat protein [Candidatus Omnitrophota bacterium]